MPVSMSFNQGFTPGSGRPQSAGINTTGFDVNPLTGETIQANSGTQQLFWQGQQAETLESLGMSELNRHPMVHESIWGAEWDSTVPTDRLGGNKKAACGRGKSTASVEMAIAGKITSSARHAVDESSDAPIWESLRRQHQGGSMGDLMVDGSNVQPWSDRPVSQPISRGFAAGGGGNGDYRSLSQPGSGRGGGIGRVVASGRCCCWECRCG